MRRTCQMQKKGLLLLVAVIALFGLGCDLQRQDQGFVLRNGWYTFNGSVIWGNAQYNDYWGGLRTGPFGEYKYRANITRNAPGIVGPSYTEDLDQLTNAMLQYGYPGFEHCFGMWFDRRRDNHDVGARPDANAISPFLEQPWARSGIDVAWDGLSKYDLLKYNDWYFNRLKDFAAFCDLKGTVLIHDCYMQHALLEHPAHYVDFPWRPTNCIQNSEMPDGLPAANAFYDTSHAVRRDIHRAYIRKCLTELSGYTNVVFLTSYEYTGPLSFVQFWIDTISEWENETGNDVHVGLGATKDVLDAVLADADRAAQVDTIDLRYWWYEPDGTLHAPPGGQEIPARNIVAMAYQTTPEQIYRQVREYRDRYPEKAIIHHLDGSRQQTWAFLMGGGSLLIRDLQYPDSPGGEPWLPPATYIAPEDSWIIQPTYDFIVANLAQTIPLMVPADLAVSGSSTAWCLAEAGQTYLVYLLAGGQVTLNFAGITGTFRARWLDPRSGAIQDAGSGTVQGGGLVTVSAPDSQDWALWLTRNS